MSEETAREPAGEARVGPGSGVPFSPPVPGAFESIEPRVQRVLITGVNQGMGRLVAKALIKRGGYELFGLDHHPPQDPEVSAQVDVYESRLTQNRAENVFRDHAIDTVVHLGASDDPRVKTSKRYEMNVVGTTRLLTWCAHYDVKNVLVMSSAMVYGAIQQNPTLLTEDSATRAAQYAGALRDRVGLDRFATAWMWKHPEVRTVILRPVHMIGQTARSAFQWYLSSRFVPVIMGFDPMLQVVHERDVQRAVLLALDSGASGVYNIAGPSALPLREMIRQVGAEPLPIPNRAGRSAISLLHRLKLFAFGPEYTDFVRFPLVVSGERARRELGFEPQVSLRETLQTAGRRWS
ncbi:MAG: NAD-dependent epimerase/dehydratase family protein [Planctomycetota bacterium]